jgi:hypothetical protein
MFELNICVILRHETRHKDFLHIMNDGAEFLSALLKPCATINYV